MQTLINSLYLVVKWTFNQETEKNHYFVLVELTTSFPVRVFHSLLNGIVIYVVMNAMKRKGHLLQFSDVFQFFKKLSKKVFFSLLISDVIISSPLSVTQALLRKDIGMTIIYYAFGFFLNWIFGFSPILILEDPSLSIPSVFVWSVHSAFSTHYFTNVLVCSSMVYLGGPLIFFTPLFIIFQLITFYDIFGFSSASEVHLSTETN